VRDRFELSERSRRHKRAFVAKASPRAVQPAQGEAFGACFATVYMDAPDVTEKALSSPQRAVLYLIARTVACTSAT
jgi:hypothetical protein